VSTLGPANRAKRLAFIGRIGCYEIETYGVSLESLGCRENRWPSYSPREGEHA
jgi:hypothetical protein